MGKRAELEDADREAERSQPADEVEVSLLSNSVQELEKEATAEDRREKWQQSSNKLTDRGVLPDISLPRTNELPAVNHSARTGPYAEIPGGSQAVPAARGKEALPGILLDPDPEGPGRSRAVPAALGKDGRPGARTDPYAEIPGGSEEAPTAPRPADGPGGPIDPSTTKPQDQASGTTPERPPGTDTAGSAGSAYPPIAGDIRETFQKDGATIAVDRNRDSSHMERKIVTGADGRVLVDDYNKEGSLTQLTIKDSDGSTTVLTPTYDKFTDMWSGQKLDADGHAIANVFWNSDHLIYMDPVTETISKVDLFDHRNDSESVPQLIPATYDADLGRLTYQGPDGDLKVASMARGRVDTIFPDGGMMWDNGEGDKFFSFAAGGARIKHSDGTVVDLFPDHKVEISSPGKPAQTESLSASEEAFLKRHQSIDRRDILQLHMLFHDQPGKLDAFYSELSKFDSSRELTASQKQALQAGLLHEVAFPAEIYQGSMGSCSVTQIERELAVGDPARLAAIDFEAIENGSIRTADGSIYELDRTNLEMQDASGRPLASRVFQDAALQIEFAKMHKEFRDSPDGAGRVYSSAQTLGKSYDEQEQAQKFPGLTSPQIADIGYELTGETHSLVHISSIDDLRAAFAANGGRPMIISVDGDAVPIQAETTGTGKGTHVITVTNIVDSPDGQTKVAFMNQWGMAKDHSTPGTMVDASQFMNNVLTGEDASGKRERASFGTVMVRGLEQDTIYVAQDGGLVPLNQAGATVATIPGPGGA